MTSWLIEYRNPDHLQGCLYGNEDRRNRGSFEHHTFSIVAFATVAFVILFHSNLHRMYAPLARLVDASIICRMVSDISFMMYYPYGENDGNCTDIYLSRVLIGLIMFGELHQLYLIANLLGLGNRTFSFLKFTFNIQSLLKVVSILMGITVVSSMIVRQFKIVRNVWVISIAALQIYVIGLSKRSEDDALDNRIVSGSDRCVAIYRKLSIMQIIPSVVTLFKRLLRLNGILVFGYWGAVSGCLDELCNILFFIKSLVIAENANVTVEVV